MNPSMGYQLIDRIAGFLDSLPERPVTRGESLSHIRKALGAERPLPLRGEDPASLLHHAADLLLNIHFSMGTLVFGDTSHHPPH